MFTDRENIITNIAQQETRGVASASLDRFYEGGTQLCSWSLLIIAIQQYCGIIKSGIIMPLMKSE